MQRARRRSRGASRTSDGGASHGGGRGGQAGRQPRGNAFAQARLAAADGWTVLGPAEIPDSAALQAAIDDHDRIRLEAGTYRLGASIELRNGVRIRGAGRGQTRIRWVGPMNQGGAHNHAVFQGSGITDVRIRDLSIDGGSSAARKDRLRERHGTAAEDGRTWKMNPEGADEVGIKRMSAINIDGAGQDVESDIRFQGLGIEDFDRYGIHVKGAGSVRLEDNDVQRCGTSRAYDHGVYLRRVHDIDIRGGHYARNAAAGIKVADCAGELDVRRRAAGEDRRRTRLDGNRWGMLLSGVNRADLRGMRLRDNDEYGLKMTHEAGHRRSGRTTVKGSEFAGNGPTGDPRDAVFWPEYATRQRTRRRRGADGRGHGWRRNDGLAPEHREG